MPNPVLTEAIDRVAGGEDLGSAEAAAVLREIMSGAASEAQSAAFLIALRTKGETVDELVGLARAMRELAVAVDASRDDLLDPAGTGGGRPPRAATTCSTPPARAADGRRSTSRPPPRSWPRAPAARWPSTATAAL